MQYRPNLHVLSIKSLGALAFAVVVAACGGQAPDSAATSPPQDSPTPVSTPAASTPRSVPALPTALPHQVPDLEAVLPRSVAGRELSIWSVRGLDFLTLMGQHDLTEAELAEMEQELALEGLTLDDIAQATAGRTDVDSDPPYFLFAYRFGEIVASELPVSLGLDHADLGTWRSANVGGKTVEVGEPEMIDQTEHARGRPYRYDSGVIRFLVVTDDPEWAAEALAQLP